MDDTERRNAPSETAFLAALDRIAANGREPTPWEAGCLYAALCAMAVEDHRTAEQKIVLCTLGDIKQPPQVQVVPPLKVVDLREALAALRPLQTCDSEASQRGWLGSWRNRRRSSQ